MIPEVERAYLAGLIDGEGSIMLVGRSSAHGPMLRVNISNTDRRLLDWVAERFGGTVKVAWRSQQIVRPNERVCYAWQRDCRQCRAVLEAALPYLISKRKHALVALAFARTQKNVGRAGHPPEVVAERKRLLDRMAELNARGRARVY
jgi:hypothetical protein